ncbi:MAG: VCBS repeat-containing protein, partial [Acidobacteriota bacterium]|nr:VCBS repeat-containing protein [Acidobacteriota bacterium]
MLQCRRRPLLCFVFGLLAAVLAAPAAQAVAPLTEPIETAAGETQGDWADQLVFEMPPSPRGFAPRIVLLHAKDARGSVVGDGFVLSAGGSIVRRSATGGVPGHTKEDLYLLDGQALVPVEGDLGSAAHGSGLPSRVERARPGTQAGMELRQELYRLEDDRGDVIRWHRASNTWTRTRDGWTWVYGQRFFSDGDAGAEGGVGARIRGARAREKLVQGATIPRFGAFLGPTGVNATQRLVHRDDPRIHGRARPHAGALDLDTSGPVSPPSTFDTATGPCSVTEAEPLPRCNTARWMLSRVEDPYGNWMLYHYTVEPMPEKVGALYGPGDGRRLLLERIEWFAAASQEASSQALGEVVFRYGPQPAPRLSFAGGTRSFSGQRLTAVEVLSGSGETYALYELEYKDEGGEDCDGEPLRLNGDDSRDLEGERPLQSLLRRVVRVDPEEPSRRRTLRCLETHHEPLRASQWSDEENITELVRAPGLTFYPGDTRITPVPVEVNGDGKMDLLLLASGSRSYDDRLFLAQGRQHRKPFEEDEDDPGSNAWLELADRHLSPDEPFLLADFNRDGYTDALYPDGEEQGALRLYTPVFHDFSSIEVDVTECDLRFATSADIDGDGYPDLVRRSHTKTDDCPGRGRTRWLRNRGEDPWFAEADWQDLQVPLDALGIKALEMEIPDLNPDWTPALFAAEQASFHDVNGDGIADLLYAFYQRWEQHLNFSACPDPPPSGDEEPCQWRPDTQSVYSRIFFGDGYGHFVDSRLHAGAPTYHHYPGWPGWYFTTYRALQDLDRSGTPELLHGLRPSGSEPYVAVASWRGVAYGFSRGTVGGAQNPWAPDELLQLPLHEYPDQGNDCFDEPEHQNLSVPVIADFDGDGFPDLLELRWDKERRQSSCDQSGWCAGIRWSERTVSQGRVTSSDGSWGGRTHLEWGFTGTSLLYDNIELRSSAEVLTAADGASGREEMGYGWGLHADGAFRGFGLVRRRNARGGLVTSVTGQSPPLQGRPLLRARHRQGGDLEKVTVTAYGRLTEDGKGYALDVEPPYFNPLLRECHFEIERTSQVPELHELIRECYAWNGRTAPSRGELWAAYGLDRWIFRTPERNTAWAAWNAPGEDEEELHPLSSWEDEPLLFWPQLLQPYYREVGWRWPEPAPVRGSGQLFEPGPTVRPNSRLGRDSALGQQRDKVTDELTGERPVHPILEAPTWLPEEPDIERVLARLPEPARGEGWTLHVTDYLYEDPAVPRPTRILYHR